MRMGSTNGLLEARAFACYAQPLLIPKFIDFLLCEFSYGVFLNGYLGRRLLFIGQDPPTLVRVGPVRAAPALVRARSERLFIAVAAARPGLILGKYQAALYVACLYIRRILILKCVGQTRMTSGQFSRKLSAN